MNLIILEPHHFLSATTAKLSGRHYVHIVSVLKSQIGDRLTLGQLNGKIGSGVITDISGDHILIEHMQLDNQPPVTLPLTLILGLPRPRMLQRTLQTIATMGVEKLCLVQTNRVEKSFWQTPLLKPESVHEQLILGLEQGKATQLPTIEYYPRFIPFLEDHLPNLSSGCCKIIAHPGDYPMASSVGNQKTLLAIGPEGGFIHQELEKFVALGFIPVQLGQRILRVETAIPVLLAKLF